MPSHGGEPEQMLPRKLIACRMSSIALSSAHHNALVDSLNYSFPFSNGSRPRESPIPGWYVGPFPFYSWSFFCGSILTQQQCVTCKEKSRDTLTTCGLSKSLMNQYCQGDNPTWLVCLLIRVHPFLLVKYRRMRAVDHPSWMYRGQV